MLKETAYAYLDGVNGKNMKQGLAAVSALMEQLGRPDKKLKIIHITGTNGKGSTSEFISLMLQKAGCKVGTFNSPYFNSPCECVRINNKNISEAALLEYMDRMEGELEALKKVQLLPSGFEILTALALWYFKEQQVDFVILEVGLGGRLDATNVIGHSIISVFTRIALDHTNVLGDSLEKIAEEKAGIIKDNSLVVTAVQEPEVMAVLEEKSRTAHVVLMGLRSDEIEAVKVSEEGTAFIYEQRPYKLQMIGDFQAFNCALAVKVIKALQSYGWLAIQQEEIEKGAYEMKWPGRFEKLKCFPEFYIDGAHNLNGVEALKRTLKDLKPAYTIGIAGVLKDKESTEMLRVLQGQFDEMIVTAPQHVRALDADSLKEKADCYFSCVTKESQINKAVQLAMDKARQKGGRVRIVAFGSLYMIADIRRILIA